MRFPWLSFFRLVSAELIGVLGLVFMAWLDARMDHYGSNMNTAQVMHTHPWKLDANLWMFCYFTSVGWLQHAHGTQLRRWFSEHRPLTGELIELLLLTPAAVLYALYFLMDVEWQFWPADLYFVLMLSNVLGYSFGKWAQLRWSKRSARTTGSR